MSVTLILACLILTAFGCSVECSVSQAQDEGDSPERSEDGSALESKLQKLRLLNVLFEPAKHLQQLGDIKTWMEEAGMRVWEDVVGNVNGEVLGADADAPALLMGSHYDTVIDGGKYDGALGIVVAIAGVKAALLRAMSQQGTLDGSPPPPGDQKLPRGDGLLKRTVRVVAFCDEEGVRFQSTFLGSRALAGAVVRNGMLGARDAGGVTLREVLVGEGVAEPVEEAVEALALDPQSLHGYVEVHIEQGPVLPRAHHQLGAVSAIAGQTRLWVEVKGTQGHAGTVPMRGRKDALATAAQMIALIEARCNGGPQQEPTPEGIPADALDMLVCTVGELHVHPGASNVIPSAANFSMDIRSANDDLRNKVVANLTASIEDICGQRGMQCSVHRKHDAPAVKCDEGLTQGLLQAIQESQAVLEELQLSYHSCSTEEGTCPWAGAQEPPPPPLMVSGAGHDGMAMAQVTKIAMIFVRCAEGISHSPDEYVLPADVAAATAALVTFLNKELN